MFFRSLLAVLVLASATSCVPPVETTEAPAKPKPVRDPRQLLRRLALDVPDDVARLARNMQGAALDETADVLARPSGAPAFLAQPRTDADAQRAADCLTAAIYYEARSEASGGQRAVAQVVLNRVRDRAFPNTICGVVWQGSQRRTGCQFSFTCDGSLSRRRDPSAWARAREVAEAALAGEVYAPVGSATHYHAAYMLPWWAPSLARVGQLGGHVFYRWRGAMERALAFSQRYAGWEPDVGAGETSPLPSPETAGHPGVAVHYGEAATGLVTVHHNAMPGTPAPRMIVASGVRVHRNGVAPPMAGEAEDAMVEDKPI